MSAESKAYRMFENPVLETLTHSHPVVNGVFWYGFTAIMLYIGRGFIIAQPFAALGAAALTYFAWTFTEYCVHRYLFHYVPTHEFAKKIFYIMHMHHHDYPDEMDRNMLPLVLTIPVGSLIVLSAYAFIGATAAPVVLAVYAFAYINYDLIHYLTHRPWAPIPMSWKRHHMLHHYRDADVNYGVQTGLWDKVFRTYKG
jgi:dihydroceramide fatty acyl 2-hydroxylase